MAAICLILPNDPTSLDARSKRNAFLQGYRSAGKVTVSATTVTRPARKVTVRGGCVRTLSQA